MNDALNIIGGIGNMAGNMLNAYQSVNPITGESELQNNINHLGNVQYAAGDLTNLSDQFSNATNIQTSGLLNREKQTFADYLGVGLQGMQAGYQLGNAIGSATGAKSFDAMKGMEPLTHGKAEGGRLFSGGGNMGGTIGALVGSGLNMAMLGINSALQDKKLDQLNTKYNFLAQQALDRNVDQFNTTLHDSTSMMFDSKALQMKAYGGPLGYFWDTFDNGVKVIKEGGTHEQNPHQGVQQGIAPDGLPNLVEEGEVIYNDFVYSDRLKLTKEQAQQFKLGGEMSYAQAALKLSKESEERPNDIISKNGLRDSMNKLKAMQEELKAKNDSKKAKRELNKLLKELPVMEEQPVEPSMQEQTIDPMSMIQQPQMMAKGGHLFAKNGQMTNWYDGLEEITNVDDTNGDILHINGKRYRLPQINPFDANYNGQQLHYVKALPEVKDADGNITQVAVPGHWEVTPGNGAQPLPTDTTANMLRMAPVFSSLAQAMQALSTKPNYQHQDAAIRAASQIPYVNYTPIGNYERFDRIDPNTQANAIRSQYAQAIQNMQNSGASRAAVNALQTNALQGLASALGEAAQTGRTYNNTLKEKEIATQLGIDQALLGASLDASKTNQGRASTYAQMVGAMAPAKQAIDDAIETNKYTTQTAVANNLGNVGVDRLNRLMQQWMIERGVYPGVAPKNANGGKLKYKTYRKKK